MIRCDNCGELNFPDEVEEFDFDMLCESCVEEIYGDDGTLFIPDDDAELDPDYIKEYGHDELD